MALPITDAAWLMMESREAPQHVGGLMVFRRPDDAGESWLGDLWQRFRTCTDVQPPFSQRLRRPYGLAGGIYHWEPDPDLDLDYHLRFSALPRPGRVRELLVLASRLHSTLLDRHRPLWEFHLIEGLEDGRFAIYVKFHHSMFDGVGAMQMIRRMVSDDPATREMLPPWALSATRTTPPVPDSGSATVILPTGGRDLLAPARSLSTIAGALRDQYVATRAGVPGEVMPFSAPRSVLNGRITGSRRFAADGVALPRMTAVAKSFDVSLNDVALAMSAHSLRSYLAERGALPDRPLTAIVPVSIRSEEQGSSGNALSFLVADLATDVADPTERLERISTSMRRGKARLASMTRTELIGYALVISSPFVVGPLLGFAGRGRPVANIVISNVPGPTGPGFFDGARLLGIYPASLLEQGQALNITLLSYDSEVQFGLTGCRRTLPHMQRMLDHLHGGLASLETRA